MIKQYVGALARLWSTNALLHGRVHSLRLYLNPKPQALPKPNSQPLNPRRHVRVHSLRVLFHFVSVLLVELREVSGPGSPYAGNP